MPVVSLRTGFVAEGGRSRGIRRARGRPAATARPRHGVLDERPSCRATRADASPRGSRPRRRAGIRPREGRCSAIHPRHGSRRRPCGWASSGARRSRRDRCSGRVHGRRRQRTPWPCRGGAPSREDRPGAAVRPTGAGFSAARGACSQKAFVARGRYESSVSQKNAERYENQGAGGTARPEESRDHRRCSARYSSDSRWLKVYA